MNQNILELNGPAEPEFPPHVRLAMRRALELAKEAAAADETPVGAAVFDENGNIIGEGRNRMRENRDPSAHAEILALRAAAKHRGNYRLPGCGIAATLEPCLMCAGAVLHARLKTVVYAAADPKTGAFGGALNIPSGLNPHAAVFGGLFAEESAELLREFFRVRR